jgi:hypothetical protein
MAATQVESEPTGALARVWELRKGKRGVTPGRWATGPLRVLPDFVIIGAQKAGTSSVFWELCQHPDVATPLRKEVHFFDLYFHYGTPWYRAHFPYRWESTRFTGESSPYYLFHPHAPARLHSVLPNAKLVAMLRNPIDRTWSHYHHQVKLGHEPLSFEDALAAEPERLEGELDRLLADPKYRAGNYAGFSYRARSCYAEQLARWLALFPREQLLVLRFEDLAERPDDVYRKLLGFLGLSEWDREDFRVHNAGRYDDRLSAATRAELQESFRSENERLYELIGEDLRWD